KDGTARWQFVRKSNRQRLLHPFLIRRASERLVVILLVLNACGFQTEFVQLVPSLFIGIAADHCQNWSTEIRWERRRMCEVFLETIAAAGDDFRIIQMSEGANQACAQPSSVRPLVRFRLPPQRRKCWVQKRPCIPLESFTFRTA